jgi:hypothetical protein
MELRNCGCGVVPLYEGKGARASSLVTSCASATGIRTGKQSSVTAQTSKKGRG